MAVDGSPGGDMPASPSPSTPVTKSPALPADPPSGDIVVQAEAANPDAAVEFDDFENDSTMGSETGSSYATSLSSSVLSYTYENGRTYHAYREGQYVMPNDEAEQDRLDMTHHIWRLILSGALYRAPISNVQRVLDIGTGTGIWAIDMADEFPSAEVIGNDLSPIQPSFVPPNCRFEIDDCESSWPFKPGHGFDFIHLRNMVGSIADWPRLLSQAWEHSRPGGWVELQDYAVRILAEEGEEKKMKSISHWLSELDRASRMIKKPIFVVEELKSYLIGAGFTSVHEDIYLTAVGTPPKDKRFRKMGIFEKAGLLESVEAYSLALFTRVLGYSLPELQLLLAQVRIEIKDPRNNLLCNAYCVYGQRPPR